MMNSNPHAAIICEQLSKEFYIVDDNLNWRVVFRDVKNQLDSFKALSEVDFIVPKGTFVGILGRNGAGKSTLLRVLGKVYSPTSGLVQTFGEISGLFEMGGIGNRRLTGSAYADRYLDVLGVSRPQRKILIEGIKAFSELGTDFNRPMYTYSSGMLARLFFATATELQLPIYLVDELLSVGDEHFQVKCWKRLRERFANGASGILVTHDWAAILKLCEVTYILDGGRIVEGGVSEKMVQRYLSLPKPTREYAEIIPQSTGYTLVSGQDCEIVFDVLLKKEVNLSVNYTVDLFRPGCGWDLILLNEIFVPVVCDLGRNPIKIVIKKLPLPAGRYYLNLFLRSLDVEVDSQKLDFRSWTYGDGIPLNVQGEDRVSATVLPWSVEIKEVLHAVA